uniref:Uncharacterized protein n=1 Tax=Leersia perrieri TaxID=77586 RepID=A0A0D9XD99_9ORYZ
MDMSNELSTVIAPSGMWATAAWSMITPDFTHSLMLLPPSPLMMLWLTADASVDEMAMMTMTMCFVGARST